MTDNYAHKNWVVNVWYVGTLERRERRCNPQPWGNQRLIQSIQAAHVPDAQVLGAQVLRAGCKHDMYD